MRGTTRRTLATLVAVFAAGIVSIASANAATYQVTRSDDPPPNGCAPGDCSLREAVIAANATPGADTIVLEPGGYDLTIPDTTEPGTGLDATQGDLDVTDALAIESSGFGAAIDAGAQFSVGPSSISVSQPGTTSRVLHVVSASLTTTAVGVMGGSADQGAGIQVENGSLEMNDGSVVLNVANGTCCGGGIGTIASDVVLSGTRISNNAVAMCCGGGIYNESSTVTIRRGLDAFSIADVMENDAFGCCGAGIYNWSNPNLSRTATLALASVGFSSNDVRDCCGGAIYNEQGGPVTVTMNRAGFSQNHASDDCCGGAIYSKRSATITASDVTFDRNTTQGCCGGAIYNEGTFTLDRGSITRNSVVNCCGGAVAGMGSESSTALTNVTVSTNGAGAEPNQPALPSAGGLYLDPAGGQLTLNHVTVTDNTGSNGTAGISNGDVGATPLGTVTLRASIVANNPGLPQCRGPIASLGYNIAADGSCGLTHPTARPNPDPRLTMLSSGHHALFPDSPAIDAVPAGQCPPPASDQRGHHRPQDRSEVPGNGCDIGAVEMDANGAPAVTPTPSATATPTPSATATPTPSTTATPSPTPPPTPTPGVTPTPTPGATPTPGPTQPATPTPGATAS
ncbi:MAG TPA: right-handed parallel beta-helix repeat-containing protein, partial [Actinomycetota bacterium]|nr:right-handed parallel beta-helix repeat-containing protein [Actinomycetota bacterium]